MLKVGNTYSLGSQEVGEIIVWVYEIWSNPSQNFIELHTDVDEFDVSRLSNYPKIKDLKIVVNA